MRVVFLFLFSSLIASHAAAVEVYRCLDEKGEVTFQQGPCEGAGEKLESGEVQAAWGPLRQGEKQLYQAYRKRDRQRHAKSRKARLASATGGSVPAQNATCYDKRHALEKVQARLRAGYKPSQGDSLRRRRDYLEGYLRRFCR